MKEATGELSTTVIAVIAIGLIATLFGTFLLPIIKTQILSNTYCTSAVNCHECSGGMCKCSYYKESTTNPGQMDLVVDAIQCQDKNQ